MKPKSTKMSSFFLTAPLLEHIQGQGIEFLQFSFRWMNCLLMREASLKNIIRMWDTYMAEGVDGFSAFHLYVCAAFLISWAKDLKKMDFAVPASCFIEYPFLSNR